MAKKVVIKSIQLSNWRGQNHKVTFNSDKTIIKAKNGIGKSTIAESFVWCISGSTNPNQPKNFNLFDNKETLSHETPLASVKATIAIDDVEYTIERQAKAGFTRKRGENTYTKSSSDNYKYLIDNIEVSVANFNDWISNNICDVNNLVYCLSGEFFSTLCENDKNSARKILEVLVGEIKESDFKRDYTLLNEKLKSLNIDQIIEQTKNNIKPLKKRLEDIPALIESKERTLADYRSIDFVEILNEIETKKGVIEEIDNTILGKAESLKPILGQRDAIFEIINSKTLSLNECRNTYLSKFNTLKSEIKRKIESVNRENELIRSNNESSKATFNVAKAQLEVNSKALDETLKVRERLLKERDEAKARVFNEDESKCGYCGQELPSDMLEKAKYVFHQKKAEEVAGIVARGKAVKESIDAITQRVKELQEIVDKGWEEEPLKSARQYEQELQELISGFVPFEETKEYATLSKEIEDLKSTLPEIPQNDNEALTNTKKAIIEELDNLNRKYGLKTKGDEVEREILTLMEEKRNLGAEIAKLEGFLINIQEWLQERANIVSNRVNDKLANCKIVMYSAQKDGSLKPDCVIVDNNNVKYATLNYSNRIKTNIELQRLFCQHYGVELPCWIDEASVFSHNNLPKLDYQHILLYASDDNYLVVE